MHKTVNELDSYYEIPSLNELYEISPHKTDVEDQKALLRASFEGDFKKVKELLKCGTCVEAKDYNKSLLYASKNYFTPLQIATLQGHHNCSKILIDYGADVNAKDVNSVTPLHLAACSNAYETLKLLLISKAECSVPMNISKKRLRRIGLHCQWARNYKIPYLDGTTPLHVAAERNHVYCVKELLSYAADFNAVDELGRTSLYIAAQRGFSECVLTHLKEATGRDILSLPNIRTSDTPLHFAVKYQMNQCIKQFLHLGADVNHQNIDGLTPLHMALLSASKNASNVIPILRLLILEGHKTDINVKDRDGFTPLHYACFESRTQSSARRPEIASFLISYGADIDIEDRQKCTLLLRELQYPEEEYEILKSIVNCSLELPRLKALNITPEIITQEPVLRTPFERELQAVWDQVFFQRNISDKERDDASSLILRKQKWYEEIVSNPRSLQHHCRFLIRKTLGVTRLKYIEALPIPSKLHSYLLLQSEK